VLAFERDGQLYTSTADNAQATRVSNGSAWHRDAAFAGSTLYYASDSLGHYDLWRVTLDARGTATGAPERLTTSPLHDVSPAPLADGRVVFQRGLGGDARLWVREADGREHRLGTVEQNERRPRVSREGTRVAYLVITETGRKAVVRPMSGGGEQVLSTEASLEDVAWAPDGRVALSTRTGVLIVPTEGAPYSNLASRLHGDLDWSPDGATLTVAEFIETTVAYNGDPDRGVDRTMSERASGTNSTYSGKDCAT
jgi:Tol biopolymer transport system component